jgi:hypothetical protein
VPLTTKMFHPVIARCGPTTVACWTARLRHLFPTTDGSGQSVNVHPIGHLDQVHSQKDARLHRDDHALLMAALVAADTALMMRSFIPLVIGRASAHVAR